MTNTKDIEQQIAELEAKFRAASGGKVSWGCGLHREVNIKEDEMFELLSAAPTMMQLIRTLHAENQKKEEQLKVARGEIIRFMEAAKSHYWTMGTAEYLNNTDKPHTVLEIERQTLAIDIDRLKHVVEQLSEALDD